MPESQLTPRGYSPTILKRLVGEKLAAARKQCGLTGKAVCEQLGWAAATLSGIERSTWVKPNSDMVADLCDVYGIEGQEREALLDMTRNARKRGWWRRHNDIFVSDLPDFESSASAIRNYEPQYIPGLLQTEHYIDLLLSVGGIADPDEIARRTAPRIQRQGILTRKEEPCFLHAVFEEGALHQIADEEVRKEQVRHLIDMARRPNVTIQIIPISAGLYDGAGEAFMYLSFPGDLYRDVVYLETRLDVRFLEEFDETEVYRLEFDKLCAVALEPDATIAHLREQAE